MALNVKKVKLESPRYFGHELDLIIKNHPYLDYNHGSRLYNMIALQDPRTMEECFDADLLSKVSNALQNRRSSTSRQTTELENSNRQEQNNQPETESSSVIVSSSSSEENIVKSDQTSDSKTDNDTQIAPGIANDSVELNSQILTSVNDEKKVENSSSPSSETSSREDKSNEMKTLNSENSMETEITVNPTHSKNDDLSDEKSDSDETRLESDYHEEEEEDEEDRIGKKVRYCVCEKKYESSNSALCDRCSNLYHVQCAGDETAKNAFKNRKNSRESIPFVCFKCRRNTQLIKQYESELKASGRWDSDCEEALSDENEKNDSSGDDVFVLSEHEGTSATKPSVVRKSRTVSAEKRKSVEESVDWIKSKCKEPNQTKLVSNLADKRKITRTKHVSISKAAENLSKKVSSLQQQTQIQKAALKSNSHGSIDNIKQMRRGSKSSISSQQTITKPVLQTQTSLSQSNEEKLVSLLQSDFEKRLSGETSETGTRLSEIELRALCQSIFNEYKKHFADTMSKFHMKMTSLRSNLTDVKNKTFYRKILNGSVVPSKLPEMSSADMMDDSLKDEEKRQEEAKLQMIIDQNVEHNVALLRHISEVNEKLGFSKLAGIDCDQETLLQTATSTRRDSLEKKQQPSESQVTDEVASTSTVSATPIEHSNRRKLNSKLEELSEKIAEEIVVKETTETEKDKLTVVDLTLKRATSIPTSPSLEKASESGAAMSSKTDEPARKISSPQISSTASAQVKPTQSVQKPEETKTTPANMETPIKSIETIKKPVVPSRTTQPVQTENNPSKIIAPLRQTSTASSKSPSPNINNTESVSVTKPPLEISTTNKSPVVKPPETLAIAKPTQIAESKQTPSPSDPSNSPTIKVAAPLLINRSLSSQSANVSPSQVQQQQSSPAPEDELLAKLPPPPPPPPVPFTEFRLKVFIELEKSFCVSTQWRNVIEIDNKKKERAFTHTPTIANYLMKHRKVNLRPRDGVRDPNVERIWPVLGEREAYVVFEVRPGGERESYQWLNNQYKSELTSDEVIFGTLKDAVEFAIAPHLSVPSKPVKCVRCFVPSELTSVVEHVYLVWVAEKKGKDLQENYRIPLDREQSRILCLMFIKTPSSSSSSTSVISPLATTTSTSSTLLSKSTSIEAGIKRKVSTPITPSQTTPTIPETVESVESKKPKVDQPQPKAVLRDPRLRPNETTSATNTPSVFEALKRLFRDIQAGKTEALTSVESLASDVDKLSDAEKLELRNEFQKFDSLKSLVGRLYDRGSEDMDICSPEPATTAQVDSVSSETSKDEQSKKSSVEKDDEKKAPAASLNDADLLIQQLKTAPTNKKITVHLPKSIKENPKELVKFYEFVNGKKHINISLDNENWRLTENYFTVEKPASLSAEGGGGGGDDDDEKAETRRSKSLSDEDDWSETEAFRPQEPAENRSSRDRSRHSNERDSRRDSWHTSRSNKSRSRSRSRVKLFSDRDSYSARGLADRFRGRGRGGPALFRGRGRGRGGAAYYKPDRYNKDRYRK